MEFRITFKNQFKAFEFMLFIAAFLIALLAYLDFDPNAVFISWTIFLIQFIPALYLHVEYLFLNSHRSLLVNNSLAKFRYVERREEFSLNFNHIARIVFYLPPSAYRGNIERKMQFLPIEPYGYAVIYSKEGDKIIITSLMVPDVYKELEKIKGVPIDKKKRLLASPSLERLLQWFIKDGL